MVANELETYQIGDKQYVTLYNARYLKMLMGRLEGQIALGKLDAVQIEAQEFIELEVLKMYVGKHSRPENGGDRIDKWQGKL